VFELDSEHTLRLIRIGDGAALARAYAANREHLEPWEPTRPPEFFTPSWQEQDVARGVDLAESARNARFVIESSDGVIYGRMNLNNIVRGAFQSADIGYWVDRSRQGRGLASRGVEALIEHSRHALRLHRLQAATLAHNGASQRVLAINGFRRIGAAPRYLRIAGEWQDHVLFQRLLDDDVSSSVERP
jgi:ribosomal-protein-alanine N-acetyltransferase